MHIRLGAKVIGQAEALRVLHGLSGRQMAVASAKALNDVGFEVRRAMQDEMRAVFKDPTDYILRSPRFKRATPERLSVTIEPAYMGRAKGKGGDGVDPQKILNAQAWGGRRRDKRSEVALRRARILPNGYQTVIPDEKYGGPFPGSDDGKGNLRGDFLKKLLSYLQSFQGGGAKVNMSEKGYKRIHKNSRKDDIPMGQKGWTKHVRGQRFFVSHGSKGGRGQHLRPGIWAVMGHEGMEVRAVLLFVQQGSYTPRLDMDKVAKRADAENYLAKRVRFRICDAAGV